MSGGNLRFLEEVLLENLPLMEKITNLEDLDSLLEKAKTHESPQMYGLAVLTAFASLLEEAKPFIMTLKNYIENEEE